MTLSLHSWDTTLSTALSLAPVPESHVYSVNRRRHYVSSLSAQLSMWIVNSSRQDLTESLLHSSKDCDGVTAWTWLTDWQHQQMTSWMRQTCRLLVTQTAFYTVDAVCLSVRRLTSRTCQYLNHRFHSVSACVCYRNEQNPALQEMSNKSDITNSLDYCNTAQLKPD